nr:hypothetical transcript [Hymenolepis microstoma]
MIPLYSDVDESLEPVPTYEDLSDLEYERSSSGSRTISYKINTNRRQDPHAIPGSNHRRHQSFPSGQSIGKIPTNIYPARQRKSSEISDFFFTDSDSRSSPDSLDPSQIGGLSGNDAEIENRRTPSNNRTSLTSRPRHSGSPGASNFSDVDEVPDSPSGRSRTRPKTNNANEGEGIEGESKSSQIWKQLWHERNRANGKYSGASESPPDLDTSASDIDENLRKTGETNDSNIETNTVEVKEEGEEWEEDGTSTAESQFFKAEEMKRCDLCSDIDVEVTRCKLCERDTCESCSDQHFDMHAEELTARLEKLNKLALAIQNELPQNRLKREIDNAVVELFSASVKALQRACEVYQAASSECNAYIGFLVDKRIKISTSTRYLTKRIPFVFYSDDLCELQHFKKVYQGAKERLSELSIEVTDPRSKAIEKLELTKTFSPNGPLLGPNNLIISLGPIEIRSPLLDLGNNAIVKLRL